MFYYISQYKRMLDLNNKYNETTLIFLGNI